MAMSMQEIIADEKNKMSGGEGSGVQPQSRAREEIEGRGSLVDQLQGVNDFKFDAFSKDVQNPLLKGALRASEMPAEIAGKGIGSIVTAMESAESGLVSGLLAKMEGRPEAVGQEFIKGITGQQNAKISDLYREGGFGEFTSEAAGFATALAGGALASKTLLLNSTKTIQRSLKRMSIAHAKNKLFGFRNMADEFVGAIDDSFRGMRGEFKALYSQIGDNAIDSVDNVINLNDAVLTLPKDVINRITREQGPNFFNKLGHVKKATINTAKIIKDKISDTIPKNVWNGIDDGGANADKFRIMEDSYWKLSDVIADHAGALRPKLLQLNAKFHRLNNTAKKMIPELKTGKGKIKTSIRNITKTEAQDTLKTMRKFSAEYFKRGDEIIREITKSHAGLQTKQALQSIFDKVAGPIAIGGSVLGAGALVADRINKFAGSDSAPGDSN